MEATAIKLSDWNLHRSEVTSVEYRGGSLRVHVTDLRIGRAFTVQFEDVEAFRVLDERDLQEFWPACSSATGGIFEINSGGWLSQEMQRPGSTLVHMHPGVNEYLVTGQNECVNVLSLAAPTIKRTEDAN